MAIHIGTCGFRGARSAYYPILDTVEVQHTFYQPPAIATLEGWRREAPAHFEFTLKAWQLITHSASSPTYRRLGRALSDEETSGAGAFRDSPIVHEAWRTTLECARALRARAVLFQCPASFRPTAENLESLRRFFETIERGGLRCCWEPRGAWDPELLAELCEQLDLWHVVDPFALTTVTPQRCYWRLHGRTGFRYTYEEEELEDLVDLLPERGDAYVFFNNIAMKQDAARFRAIVERRAAGGDDVPVE